VPAVISKERVRTVSTSFAATVRLHRWTIVNFRVDPHSDSRK
jgi:hypothetical protein